MEVRRYLAMVRRRLLLAVVIVAAAIAAGWFITPQATSYTATATLYVGSQSIDGDPTSGEVSGDRVQGFDRIIATFTELLRSRASAEAALDATGIDRTNDELRASTSAAQVQNTNLIKVSVTDTDPADAQELVNALADTFVDQISSVEAVDSSTEGIVSVYETATRPTDANPTSLVRNLMLATIIGIVAAGVVIALLEHLDLSLRSTDDLERHLELPVLGAIPALGSELPAIGGAVARPANPPAPSRTSEPERSVSGA
jgi:capsular polysaccharide biosynthesis protein